MNEMFSQGGKGSTGILTNKQAIARKLGVKQSEVLYYSQFTALSGYKVIYDKATQKAYSLPTDIPPDAIAADLTQAGVLYYGSTSVDLGALAVQREEYITLPGSFSTGVTVNTKNELVIFTDGKYRWDGELPKIAPAGSTPASTGGVGLGAWVSVGYASLRSELAGADGAQLISLTQSGAGAVSRTVGSKLSDVISVKDFGAVGDGSTDDTDAIKAAIVAAVAYSGRAAAVHFPGGFYNVSATIEVPSWVQLVGDGIETTQLRCVDTSVEHVVLLPNGSQFNGIRGMTVRYSTMPTSSGVGIGIKSFQPFFHQIKVIDCYIGIKIYANDGAVTSTATGIFVEQFQINDCSYVGLMVGSSNNGFCNDITFRDGLMVTTNSNHFYLGGIRVLGQVESLTLTNIDMIGGRLPYTADAGSTEGLRFSTFTGVYFDSGAARCEFGRMRHCQFTNCWISGGRTNGTEGAIFTDVQNTSFTGLRVYNCGGSGLVFENCSYMNISQASFGRNNINSLGGSQYHMTFDAKCSHFTVQNCTSNESTGTVASGVYIASGATYYTVSGNHFGQVTVPVSEGNTNAQGRYVADNAFYNTYATGSGILAPGSTSVKVAHGLAVVPQLKQIRIQQNGATVNPMYVQGVDGTYITIATTTSNASNAPFTWEADATRY